MGSQSDMVTMKNTLDILDHFGLQKEYEMNIISAHRTPNRLYEYSKQAEESGIKVIIAGAGGSAHLPGMVAAITHIPVLGVPVESRALKGLDSLLSIAQMPAGIPVGSLAIGEAGAKNAALLAIAILATSDDKLAKKLKEFRKKQTAKVKMIPIR